MQRKSLIGAAVAMVLGVSATGCGAGSPSHADADADGRPDAVDLCPGTSAAAMAGPDGCTHDEDGDHDGLSSADDLCPGTPAGATVDAYGCSAEQRQRGVGSAIFGDTGGGNAPNGDAANGDAANGDATNGTHSDQGATGGDAASSGPSAVDGSAQAEEMAKQAQALLADPPPTGTLMNGYVALVVDQESDRPLVFFTLASNLVELDDGFEVHGALLLTTPLGEVPMANASVVFEYGDDRALGLERVRGDVAVPFPGMGALAGFEVADLVTASIGWDYGKNLTALGAPIQDDRKYLFFNYQQGIEATSGPISITLPGGADATLIFDPFDPSIFARGSLLGLSAFGGVDDVAIGLSAQGFIPFTPKAPSIGTHELKGFNGHLFLSGSVPLEELPLTVTGDTVLDIDPNGDGRPLSELDEAGAEIGINGGLSLTADFLDVLSFEAPLEQATADIRITQEDQSAYLTGELAPDHSFFPDELPLRADERVDVTGYLSNKLEDSYLAMDGEYRLVGSSLAQKVGVDLSDLAVAKAHLDIDHRGFRLTGELRAGVELAKDLEIGGGAKVEAFFADSPTEFHVTITGDVTVAGQRLLAAEVKMNADGLFVQGALDTGVARVALSGTITSHGAELTGEASANIDVKAGKDVVETVVDGTLCGYEYVTDGGKCGYEVVTDGGQCGYEKVTDGGQCGYEVVTNGAVCGYNSITSAAKCGEDTVTNGAKCGYHEVCSVLGAIGIHVCDDSPNTCSVPKTCTDYDAPKTCTDFDLPKTCDDLSKPKTCADLAHPKTCEDLSQPKSCDHHDVIPDYDYGTVKAAISVSLGTNGVSGDVSGDYCPTSGGCTKLAGGRVKVGDSFEACIDVPPGLGEFCAPF